MAANKLDPRSNLGGVFRAALKSNPTSAEEYAGLSRDQAAMYRMNWAKLEFKKFRDENLYSSSWRGVDLTKSKHTSISQLVIDDIGWNDRECIAGVQKLVETALAMGSPWVKRTPRLAGTSS